MSTVAFLSQSAFVRGFIDDLEREDEAMDMIRSQSAFVRGFIDDLKLLATRVKLGRVSIRVRARLHR